MNAEGELLQVGKAWDEAMIQNNSEEIGKFMSDDWVIVGSDGITTKSEFMESIRSGDLTHNRMDSDETRIKVYDTMAVVTSRGTSAGKYKGEPFELYEWSSSVFIYENQRWICVHTMLTPANNPEL
jgi:hypothetical protein